MVNAPVYIKECFSILKMMFVEGKYIIILIANVSKSGMSQILLTGLLRVNKIFYRNINIVIYLINSLAANPRQNSICCIVY